ncbi:MAG: hypothetical protein ACTTJH_00950 [Bacteroidales bacterium]
MAGSSPVSRSNGRAKNDALRKGGVVFIARPYRCKVKYVAVIAQW